MDTILHDIRYAGRMLRKAPGASAVAIISLAIGIGINTTVFGWIRSILLNPLPGVADSGRIITIETVAPSGTLIDSSYPDYQTWRDRATLLSGVIAFKERPLGVGDDTSTERVWTMLVSGNYFDVLGVKPALGRFFEGDEQSDTFDAHPVAVLGHAMWTARFNGDPAIVGRTITLNRQSYAVVGVAPEGFSGTISGLRFDLFVPLTMQAALTGASQWLAIRTARPLYVFARLEPGVTIEQAGGELSALAAARAGEFPDSNRNISATPLPLSKARRGAQQALGPLLKILMAVGAIVLLIVCANVANLQLARAMARRREIGVRLGLGATRGRLIQQMLTEGLVLGAAAGLLGALLSAWLIDTLRFLLPFIEYPLVLPTAIDGRELLFAAAATVVASALFALAPALRASASSAVAAMNAGRHTEDLQSSRVGAVLVGAQVALAMVALVGAALLVRSFENARRANTGFDAHGVLLAGINLSIGGYDRDSALRYLDRAVEAARSLPGVRSVSLAEDVPLGFNGGSWEDLAIDGYVPGPSENMKIYRNYVAPSYFETMGIRLVAGRDVSDADTRDTARVAVVNETFVRRYVGTANPIGRRFTGMGRPITVVGVVADSKYHQLTEAAQPYVYVPLRQFLSATTGVALHVRLAGAASPLAAAPALRDVLRGLDPRMPPPVLTTLEDYTSAAYFTQRLAATLLTILASLALALSAIGLYSLIAYAVARRRREIGVRMALGATGGDILRLVVGRGLSLVAVGAVAGTVLALVAARALGSLLFGVTPLDAPAVTGAALLLTAIAGVASYIPARAAARVEPMSALRAD